MQKRGRGFTIVELLIVIIVIGILATVTVVGYGGWQRNVATDAVKNDVQNAGSSVKNSVNFNNTIPGSLSFTPSKNVALQYKTNGSPHYTGLTTAQNAQLFINLCNSVMPLKAPDNSQIYVTQCVGQWGIDVTGGAHNSYLSTPIQSSFMISDNPSGTGSYYNPYNTVVGDATAAIKTEFLSQGGTFPVTVQNNTPVSLPAPDSSGSSASTYCIQATSLKYPDIVYRVSDSNLTPVAGQCP